MNLRKSEMAMLCLTALFVLAAAVQAFLPTRQPAVTLVRPAAAADERALRTAGDGRIADGPGRINVNTADAAALAELPGIGEVLAGRIVTHREEHGPFESADALKAVPGIGEKTVEALRDLITCEEAKP